MAPNALLVGVAGTMCVSLCVLQAWMATSADPQPDPAEPRTGSPAEPRTGSPAAAGSRAGALLAALLAGPVTVALDGGTAAGAKQAESRKWPVPRGGREGCVLAFDVKFRKGFFFGCQGKVGGVHIGKGRSAGCDNSETGASHRLMWRPNNGGQSYVYVPPSTYSRQPHPLNKAGKFACGMGLFNETFEGVFTTDAWHRVEIGTRLNTPGASDGIMHMRIDDRVAELQNVVWRKDGGMQIESAVIGVFFGGGCTGRRSTMEYRNVAVHAFV